MLIFEILIPPTMLKKLYISIILSAVNFVSFGQIWYDQLSNGANYYEVRESFNEYIENVHLSRRGPVKPFERWAHRMSERSYPSGVLENAPNYYKEIKKLQGKSKSLKSSTYPSWTSLGPNVVPFGGGNGRLNFITFHPDTLTTIYVGAPAGGLWKSKDNGVTFEIVNDTLPVIGCSDLLIDPVSPNVMYLATGDRDGNDTYSIGVLKSLDGGISWDTTGLDWKVSDLKTIARLAINPLNHNMIIAATSDGLYKSTDAGETWSRRRAGNFKDVHFRPGDSSILYISGSELFVSNDAGETFGSSNVNGFIGRIEMAVTVDDPNYVYALAASGADNGLHSIWRSTNSGLSFTKVYDRYDSGNKNLLTWDQNGNGGGGQGWYDLALAVSPFNKNRVIVGGINVWESTNGGSSWNIIAHWTGSGAFQIHADQHDLIFKPGTDELYAANDGGIYHTDNFGMQWTDLTATLQITQSYRLGISQNTSGLVLAGNQDNGTIRRDATGAFVQINGGDGFECIVDHTTDQILYSSIYYGQVSRSTNGGTFISIAGSGVNGINESGAWETPYVMDPYQNNVLFIGMNSVWRTNNSGQNWLKRNNTTLPSNGKINQLQIAPWDLDMLIATKNGTVYLTENSGQTFTNITNGLPNLFITNVQFSPEYNFNDFTAYVTFSGYSNNLKVFKTTNSGQSWTNISDGLPNVPANCVLIDPTTPNDEQLYVGTDIGVFYKNSSMSAFEPYSIGLPNTIIEEMELQMNDGKIVACTYGRGLWEVPLLSSLVGLEDGTNVLNENTEISVFPNPFENSLDISYRIGKVSDIQIDIYDLQGKLIFRKSESNVPTGDYTLNLNEELVNLKKGMYFLKFRSGAEEISSKIVKN